MANKIHVKKDDQVVVISGKDAGTIGKVIKTEPSKGRVYVEGANIVKKHQKARSQNAASGIIEREGSIDASNVMLVCPKCGKATRVAHKVNEDGSKDRVCKKCGAVISTIKKVSKGG